MDVSEVQQPAAQDLPPEADARALKRASYLLGDFPHLVRRWRAAQLAVLYGSKRREAFVVIPERGKFSDPTGQKAVGLVTLREYGEQLRIVRVFIEKKIKGQRDRELLIAVWRRGRFGWYAVGRVLDRDEADVRADWLRLVGALAPRLPAEKEADDGSPET